MLQFSKYIIVFIVLFISSTPNLNSQDFREGYEFLDSGAYEEAISYFAEQLVQSPQNKTANICYGRAIGLSGEKEKALAIFQKLENDFPTDQEIKLNKAEAYLWNKYYDQALNTYQTILKNDSLNFNANIGVANTYSAMQNYTTANKYLKKAIQIDPSQPVLKPVKKYIFLGLAANAKENLQTANAHQYLDSILTYYPNDKEVLLERAFVYLYEENNNKALHTFNQLIDKNPFEAYLGLSHCSILLQQAKNSLFYADSALVYRPVDSLQRGLRAEIAKIYALGFNKKFSSAHALADRLIEAHPENIPLQIAKSRLYSWNNQFSKSEQNLYNIEPQNFETLLAKADLYRGMELKNKALSIVDSALLIQPLQVDATRLQDILQSEVSPLIHFRYSNLTDIVQNHAEEYYAGVQIRSSDRHQYSLGLQNRNTNDPLSGDAYQRVAKISDNIRINRNLNLTLGLSVVQSASESTTFTKVLHQAGIRAKLTNDQYLSAGYIIEPHNFNSILILSQILMNNYYLDYSFNTREYPGIYIRYTRTNQSDDNHKNLLYLSLYKTFQKISTFKFGLNYTYFGFSRNADIYFSPLSFSGLEGFVEYHNYLSKKKQFTYNILLAPGLQKIEDNAYQNTLRINFQLECMVNKNFTLYGSYQYSDAAATTTAGYTSNYFMGGLKYSL